jgi:hypothetical protein
MPRIIHAISGPRNISTALLYAFSQRSGCVGVDEPFYGPFLIVLVWTIQVAKKS